MERHFTILKATRGRLLTTISDVTADQLLTIPAGFKNHIGWNFCHILATQQLLTYGRCGLPMIADQSFVDMFKKGSTAPTSIDGATLEYAHGLAISSVIQLGTDVQAGAFADFEAYTTSYGFHLANIEDAIAFNNVHEGLHLGYIMAQKRSLGL